MIIEICRWVVAIFIAFVTGKIISYTKLPSILGWLVAGIFLGPNAFNLVTDEILNAKYYYVIIHIMECSVGLMIGNELVWRKIKNYGKALVITTLFQSLGTFVVVSAIFAVVLYFVHVPIYIAFIFGGIALATAPAPVLSIVREFKTKGPVTNALIPMAALDDLVGIVVFFTTIAIVVKHIADKSVSFAIIPVMILVPLLIGAIIGIPSGFILKKVKSKWSILAVLCLSIVITSAIGYICNIYLMEQPLLNFMTMGMALATAYSNIVSDERLEKIEKLFSPFLGFSMIVVILNLGAPLDYHAIMGAGFYTFIYILFRALGKYFGARLGASVTKMHPMVRKYLGFTLLPHSGVSLVFTGIAVSLLVGFQSELAKIIQGTITAAAVINEIIALIMAKKGFEWSGEMEK